MLHGQGRTSGPSESPFWAEPYPWYALAVRLGPRMEAEIRDQPSVLAERGASYAEQAQRLLQGASPAGVLLIARGSSDNAATYARYLIETQLGIPCSPAAPSVLTRYSTRVRYPGYLALAVSQSGASPDVAAALADARDQGCRSIAVTNTPESRIGNAADGVLDLGCGAEESVAATKSYTASLAALYEVVRALGAPLPDPRPMEPGWVEECRRLAEAALPPLLAAEVRFVVARGYRFASALETALKLVECPLLMAKGYSVADFLHGPLALAGEGAWVATYGEAVPGDAQVSHGPDCGDRPDSPILDVVFGQWLALLAARARGIDPDQPPRIAKVTRSL